MQQKSIQIGNVQVPIIIDGGEEWFPVSYIAKKILLKENNLINKNNRAKLSIYLNKYTIKFGENNIQESNCINKEGLKKLFSLTQATRLNSEQRRSQNLLHKYLNIDLLPEEEFDSSGYRDEWLKEVDEYTKDIIQTELKVKNVEWIRLCSKCNCHYPLTNRFFKSHPKAKKGFNAMCNVCIGYLDYFNHPDHDKQKLRNYSQDLFLALQNDYLPKIVDAFLNNKINRIPDCYRNKEGYIRIIKYLYKMKHINKNNLTMNYLKDDLNFNEIYKYLSIDEIYTILFGEDFYYYIWKYPKFTFRNISLTNEIGNQIIHNYLNDHNIVIEDIFNYDYETLFKKCKLNNLIKGDLLGFIVQFYKNQYAGYLFKIQAVNYYKNEENLLFDLKYLVEKDMKIDISKIPLYLTKYTLQKKSISLYNYIIGKRNGSLFDWFNKLYPGKFTINDFELNGYRNEFDSDKEMYIHELLTESFKNVIYNQKHTDRTLKLDDMIPDWFVMTENGVWIIEYFGLYEERQYGKSSRVTDYINKTKSKIERYKEMKGYKFIFLYPKDIEDNFKGCREIIVNMRDNPCMSML